MTVVQGLPYLLQGLAPTLLLFLGGAVGALGLAFAAGLLLRSPDPVLRGAARSYVGLFRGWPVLILLFWLYFVFPPMLGIAWGAYPIGIGALALNGGAYGAEIVRGALAAVPRGQGDAARALGLTRGQVLRCILLPQAFVAMLPPLGNLMVELLKATALVSVIAVPDLLGRALRWRDDELGRVGVIFLLVLVVYFALGQAVRLAFVILERRAGRFRAAEPGR